MKKASDAEIGGYLRHSLLVGRNVLIEIHTIVAHSAFCGRFPALWNETYSSVLLPANTTGGVVDKMIRLHIPNGRGEFAILEFDNVDDLRAVLRMFPGLGDAHPEDVDQRQQTLALPPGPDEQESFDAFWSRQSVTDLMLSVRPKGRRIARVLRKHGPIISQSDLAAWLRVDERSIGASVASIKRRSDTYFSWLPPPFEWSEAGGVRVLSCEASFFRALRSVSIPRPR